MNGSHGLSADGKPPHGEKAGWVPSFPRRRRVPWFVPHPNWRFTALLVADLLLVFVAPPILSEYELPAFVGSWVALLITAGTIALVSDRRAVQVGVIVILLVAAALHALPAAETTTSALQAACAALVTLFVGRAVLSRGEVDTHRVAGGVAVYLNISLAFAASYIFLGDVSPAAFAGLTHGHALRIQDMVHFSLTTLTTLGYGDIVPRSPVARSMADLEALIGQLFPATLLARLIGLLVSRH